MRSPLVRIASLAAFAGILLAISAPGFGRAAETHESCCGTITAAGERLAATLDGMNVESLWLAHEHVNWETGEQDRAEDNHGPANHTHCSAFAAAAAKLMGVYLLRPPEHGQVLLANAQAEWLKGAEGRKAGWESVSNMREAQRLANQGNLVLVVFASPDRHMPGHVAIVRPSAKSLHALDENGPQTIQAGNHNFNSTNVRMGFHNHEGAWPAGVRYYVHRLAP